MAITVRIACLVLPDAELRTAVSFENDPVVQAALQDDGGTFLLWPDAHAAPLETRPPEQQHTLILVDGTWSQARRVVNSTPSLARVPRVRFEPKAPGNYRIRSEPAAHCLATIEALGEVLDYLRPSLHASAHLLPGFNAMVEHQLAYAAREQGWRSRHTKSGLPRESLLPEAWLPHWDRVVLVHGESNAWPLDTPHRPTEDRLYNGSRTGQHPARGSKPYSVPRIL